jgi:hypothetical protein
MPDAKITVMTPGLASMQAGPALDAKAVLLQ